MSIDIMKLDVAKKKIMFVYNRWHTVWTAEKLAEVAKIDNKTFEVAEDAILKEFTHDELVTFVINNHLRRCDYSCADKAKRDSLIAMRERIEQIRLDMCALVEIRHQQAKQIIFNNEKKKIRVAKYYAYQALEVIVLCNFGMVKVEETLIELEDSLKGIKGDEVVTDHPCTSNELSLGI